jgi:DNA-binding NarL/FixJ family response regulator
VRRLFILSGHPMFSQGLERLLCQESGLHILGLEANMDLAMVRIKDLKPDVVIVDWDGPASGLTPTAARILNERLGIRVIGISLEDNTLIIYEGEQRLVQGVADLLEAIKQ